LGGVGAERGGGQTVAPENQPRFVGEGYQGEGKFRLVDRWEAHPRGGKEGGKGEGGGCVLGVGRRG